MGYKKMFEIIPAVMKAQKMLPPGSFDFHNHHGGVMPGWPKESTLTNLRASKILRACINKSSILTFGQLNTIRTCLSYLWELTGQKNKKDTNWPCVGAMWESTVRKTNLLPSQRIVTARRIPQPQTLRRAINKGWSKANRMPFMEWAVKYLCFWDSNVCGARANVDHAKIKMSRTHDYNYEQGWCCTKFVMGRAKLNGVKKHSREWWMWRICMCKGSRHVRPAENSWSYIDEDGNPRKELNFDPSCPLACTEFVWQCQLEEDKGKRDYPNWVKRSKKSAAWYGPLNIGDPAQAAFDWLKAQGVLDDFDHNSGRKALAAWCKLLSVPYIRSVHLHGDLHGVWNKHYQKDVPEATIKIREQSRDPQVATAALRTFARWCGRGVNPYKPVMTLVERQNHLILSKLYSPEVAEQVLMGQPLPMTTEEVEPKKEEDDEKLQSRSDNTPFRSPVAPRPVPLGPSDFLRDSRRPRKRKRPARACRARAPSFCPPALNNDGELMQPRRKKPRWLTRMLPPALAVRPLRRKRPRKNRIRLKRSLRVRLKRVDGKRCRFIGVRRDLRVVR
jgi:hypothetical protein